MTRTLLSSVIATSVLFGASVSLAQEAAPPAPNEAAAPSSEAKGEPEEGFGKAGVINIASDLSLSVQHTSYSAPSGVPAPSSVTAYAIGPAADFFVIDNLSVGGQILFSRVSIPSDTEVTETGFAIAPRVGYHISLVPERLGLWPRVEFGYAATTLKVSGAPDATEKKVLLGAFVPLLIHPVEHFHIGIGPFFETDLSAKEDVGGQSGDGIKETTFGLRTEIGGWFGL